MKKKNKNIVIIVIVLVILDLLLFNFIARAYISYQEIFVKSYIEKTSKTKEYNLVQKSFKDTLNKGFDNLMILNSKKVNHDIIIFNEDKSKGLIYNILMYGVKSKFDYIEPIGFIMVNGKYIFNSLPQKEIIFLRKENMNKPYTLKYLKKYVIYEIASSQYIFSPLGIINYKYIDTGIYPIKELVEFHKNQINAKINY